MSTKEQLLEAGGGCIFGVVCFGDFSRVAVKPTRCAGFSELGWGNERLNTARVCRKGSEARGVWVSPATVGVEAAARRPLPWQAEANPEALPPISKESRFFGSSGVMVEFRGELVGSGTQLRQARQPKPRNPKP